MDSKNKTRFFGAVIYGDPEKVTKLLELGVDVNIVDQSCLNYTALHHAVENNRVDNVKALLNQPNIKIDALSIDGKTPKGIAEENDFKEIKQLIEEYTQRNQASDPQPGPFTSVDPDLDLKANSIKKRTNGIDNGILLQNKKSRTSYLPLDDINSVKDKFHDESELKSEGLKLAQHGNIYQLKVLMLFLWRVTELDYSSFRLATEHGDAEKFDDAVFQYQKNSNWVLRLVQAKHREETDSNIDVPKISQTELFPTKKLGNFSLVKYVLSFLKIEQTCDREYFYSVFSGSQVEDVTLLTNAGIDNDLANLYFKEISLDQDEILGFIPSEYLQKAKAFKLKETNNEDLVTKLQDGLHIFSDFNVLVTRIFESAKSGEMIKLEGVFKEYCYPLMYEMFEIKQSKTAKGVKNEIVLKITEELPSTQIMQAILDKLNSDQSPRAKKLKMANGKLLKTGITVKFTSGWEEKLLPTNDIKGIPNFADQFVNMIREAINNKTKKIIITDSPTCVPNNELKDFRNNMKSIAGHVLVYDGNRKIRFSSLFLKGVNLPEQIQTFRRHLEVPFTYEFQMFFEYEFEVPISDFKMYEENYLSKKLPCPITDEDIAKFIDKFKFITNYPNRFGINSLLSAEIQDKLNKLDSEAFTSLFENHLHKWMAQRIGTFYKKPEAIAMFQGLLNNLLQWTMDGFSNSYLSVINNEFDFKTFDAFVNFLKNKNLDLLVIEGHLEINRIKFTQTFLELQNLKLDYFKKYTTGFGYLFIHLKSLANNYYDVLSYCQNNHNLNLIVVESDEKSNTELENKVINLLQHFNGKVIILCALNDSLDQTLNNVYHPNNGYSKIKSSFEFHDLKEPSQVKLLKMELIKFQGRKINTNLNHLLDIEAKQLIDLSVFTQLLNNTELSIGQSVPEFTKNDEDYYIERILKLDEIKEDVLKPNGIIRTSDEQIQCTNGYDNVSNHMNDVNENELIMMNSLSEEDLAKEDIRIAIISDVAGMGKTTLLTKISHILRDLYPTLWVLRVNLNDFEKQLSVELENRTFSSQTSKEAIGFLVRLLDSHEKSKFKSKFERELFIHKIAKTGELAILFDAFDEICPKYTEIVDDLLQVLIETNIKKLIVTTRPLKRRDLKCTLKAQVYVLEELSDQEQINFLTKFWQNEFRSENFGTNSFIKLEIYAKAIIKNLASSIKDQKPVLFCGIPLQLKMIAVAFQRRNPNNNWESCLEFINSEHESPKLPRKLKLIELYRGFIEEKLRIFCLQKSKLDFTNQNQEKSKKYLERAFMEEHQYLAIAALFEEEHQNNILNKNERQDLVTVLKDGKDYKETRGLVVEIIDDRPHFVHRTFAEYFAAVMLNNKLGSLDDHFFFENIFVLSQYEGVRKFLNEIFEEYIEQNNLKCLEALFIHTDCKLSVENLTKIMLLAAHESNNAIVFGCLAYYIHRSSINNPDNAEAIELQNQELRNICNATDAKNDTLIHFAANDGNVELINILLNINADSASDILKGNTKMNQNNYIINELAEDDEGWTAAHVSAMKGHDPVVELFINRMGEVNREAFLNLRDVYGMTILHRAAQSGNLKLVKLLYEKRADLEAKDNDEDTAVHIAALSGHTEVVEFLISRMCQGNLKTSINLPNKNKRTPLHHAVHGGNLETVEFLLNNGANVDAKDDVEDTAAHLAALGGHTDVVDCLIDRMNKGDRKANLQLTNVFGRTLLHRAAQGGHLETVEFLLNNDANLWMVDDDGKVALHLAAFQGHTDVVKFLIKRMSLGNPQQDTINLKDKNGNTLLHLAADRGNLDTIKYLIENGADLDARDNDMKTVAHLAILRGQPKIVEFLIEWMSPEIRRVRINLQDKFGRTLLHCAALSGNLETVKFLVENGADIFAEDFSGNTAAFCAALKGHDDIIHYLLGFLTEKEEKAAFINKPNIRGNTILLTAAEKCSIETVRFLVENGGDVMMEDNDGDNVLHCAAVSKDSQVLVSLIDWIGTGKRKEVIVKGNKKGDSLLHYASECGNLETVKFLVEYGLDLSARNKDGLTPARVALDKGHNEVVEYLVLLTAIGGAC